jgi:hypothetical protein
VIKKIHEISERHFQERNSAILLESSQLSHPRPSDESDMEVKTSKLLARVAWAMGCGILIS